MKHVIRILCVLLALGLVAAPGRSQSLTTIHVIALPIDAGAEVIYAKDLGSFAKVGLDVEILPASNGGASASAVAGCGAEIGYADTVSLSSARGKPSTGNPGGSIGRRRLTAKPTLIAQPAFFICASSCSFCSMKRL